MTLPAVQLWSYKSPGRWTPVLKELLQKGITKVEFAGFGESKIQTLLDSVEDASEFDKQIEIVGIHGPPIPMNDSSLLRVKGWVNEYAALFKQHKRQLTYVTSTAPEAFGTDGVPTAGEFDLLVPYLNAIASHCHQIGVGLQYHTYPWDFIPLTTSKRGAPLTSGFDIFSKALRDWPKFGMQLDLYWMHAAGASLASLPNRSKVASIHLNDADANMTSVPLGKGVLSANGTLLTAKRLFPTASHITEVYSRAGDNTTALLVANAQWWSELS